MDMYNREPGDMNDREPGGFHAQCMSSDMYVWIKTFLKIWTELMWLALKVVFLLVERLVRTHANLKLEQRLELYEAGMLPWDIQMTVEEPLSDDKDGIHHGVSDSESESDKDSD